MCRMARSGLSPVSWPPAKSASRALADHFRCGERERSLLEITCQARIVASGRGCLESYLRNVTSLTIFWRNPKHQMLSFLGRSNGSPVLAWPHPETRSPLKCALTHPATQCQCRAQQAHRREGQMSMKSGRHGGAHRGSVLE